MWNTTETTVQALERQCIAKVTADMRCPKSQSHGKYLMSCLWYAVTDLNAYLALEEYCMCGSCMLTGYLN